MSGKIQLSLPTEFLRSLIESNPETVLTLESLAAEKIGEEIMRKVKNLELETIQNRVNQMVSTAIQRAESTFKDKYTFPKEASVEIGRAVRETMDSYFRQKQLELSVAVDKTISQRSDEAKERIINNIVPIIKEHARREFVAVLSEVRSLAGKETL